MAPLVNKNHPDEFARLAECFKRPGTGAWARFSEPARQVIFVAQEEAAALGENRVGPEHLLLGLTRVPDICAKILTGMGVSLQSIREEVLRQATRGQGNPDQEMLLTPRAKVVIDLAYAEAWMSNSSYLGVEHLLIGMLSEAEGLAAQVLVKLGVTLERARAAVWAQWANANGSADEGGRERRGSAGGRAGDDAAARRRERARRSGHVAGSLERLTAR